MNNWSRVKGVQNPNNYIELTCNSCKKNFLKAQWIYNRTLKKYPNQENWYCSPLCRNRMKFGHKTSDETKEKIRQKQIGISCPQRGRKGRITSEETRKKISNSRKGIKSTCDWDIVISDLHNRGITSYVVTRKPVPDSIYIEDNQLVALEIEKKTNESDAKRKMLYYENMNGYNKVIIVWYSRGIKRKEWTKTKSDPNWKETIFS